MKNTLLVIIGILAIQLSPLQAEELGSELESPLNDIVHAYKAILSYEDTGKVEVIYNRNGLVVGEEVRRFQTQFKRGKSFEIRWKDVVTGYAGLEYVIWSSGNKVYSKYGNDEAFESPTIAKALSRATGISTSLTAYIPCLLLQDTNCFLCSPDSLKITSSVSVPDSNLIHIAIDNSYGDIDEIWFDKASKLIKRIEWWTEDSAQRTYHRITYENIKIKNKM